MGRNPFKTAEFLFVILLVELSQGGYSIFDLMKSLHFSSTKFEYHYSFLAWIIF